MSNVVAMPRIDPPRPEAGGLNLADDEVRDAAGGYKRPAEQLRELHVRGFSRAYRAQGGRGRVILERSHYEAVTRGQYGPPPTNDQQQERQAARPDRAALRQFFKQKRKQ